MMKKSLGLAFVMAYLAVLPVFALNFGVRGGVNMTDLKLEKNMFDTKYRYGWFIGPTLKASIPFTPIGFDISMLYEQKEVKIEDTNIKQQSVVIPVNARLNLGLSDKLGLYLAAGPQFGFNVGDDSFDWGKSSSYKNTFQLRKSSFSINLGAGVSLAKWLELGIVYNIAMGTTGEASWDKSWKTVTSTDTYKDDTKSKSWAIQACLYF